MAKNNPDNYSADLITIAMQTYEARDLAELVAGLGFYNNDHIDFDMENPPSISLFISKEKKASINNEYGINIDFEANFDVDKIIENFKSALSGGDKKSLEQACIDLYIYKKIIGRVYAGSNSLLDTKIPEANFFDFSNLNNKQIGEIQKLDQKVFGTRNYDGRPYALTNNYVQNFIQKYITSTNNSKGDVEFSIYSGFFYAGHVAEYDDCVPKSSYSEPEDNGYVIIDAPLSTSINWASTNNQKRLNNPKL